MYSLLWATGVAAISAYNARRYGLLSPRLYWFGTGCLAIGGAVAGAYRAGTIATISFVVAGIGLFIAEYYGVGIAYGRSARRNPH